MPSPPPRSICSARPTTADQHGAVVAFLALDGRAERLAAEHIPDPHGRCRCCTAGPQRGRVLWPCVLATLAARGRELARRSR